MRIVVIDESASRASIIQEGLAQLEGSEVFVLTERKGLVARVAEISPDVVLIDLGNPSRDVLEDYFQAHAQARGYVLDDQGKLRHHMAAFIDGRQVRRARWSWAGSPATCTSVVRARHSAVLHVGSWARKRAMHHRRTSSHARSVTSSHPLSAASIAR